MVEMVIVDNQENELNELKDMVLSVNKEIEITGTGLSGREAIRLVEEKAPDILFVAVSLPEMSGLEVTKRIRSNNKDIVVILKSAYDYFDFAREAMELGVAEYFLKPVSRNGLSQCLKKIVNELKVKEKTRRDQARRDSLLDDMREFAEYSFIYATLFDGGSYAGIRRYKELLGLYDYGYIINLELESIEPDSLFRNKKDSALLYRTIKKLLAEKAVCAVGPMLTKRQIIYISVPKERTAEGLVYGDSVEMARCLVNGFKKELGLNILAGVGSNKGLDKIHDSYEEALRCLRYDQNGFVIHIRDIEEMSINYDEYMVLEAKMIDSIKFGKDEGLECFTLILDYLMPLKEAEIKNKIMELLVLACRSARQEGQNESEYINYDEYFRELSLLPQNEIRYWAHKRFEYIIKAIRTSRSARKSDTIKEAIQYIADHFVQELSLDEVAQYVGISPQHFSKLFKEETGSNYVEYLTRLRMETAKDYLKDGGKTIKEICYAVGYNDPNYFSRLFKKTMGISPTEYVKVDEK